MNPPPEVEVEALIEELEEQRTEVLCFTHEEYPALLKEIYDPPVVLFYRGRLELLNKEAFAVVGTRRPTRYGRNAAAHLTAELVQAGLVIVSGMARGIDTVVHQTVLEHGGDTIAVLGCGVDRVYPAENRELHHAVGERGLLLSEYPPGTEPEAGNFPRRNRIISGLSRGVLVVEAAERSGALITAWLALDQNREVFAVPGPIFAQASQGTNNLIRQGAKLVTRAEDILEEFETFRLGKSKAQTRLSIALPMEQQQVWDKLSENPIHVDDLAEELGISTFTLLGTLLEMELAGLVKQLPGKQFVRSIT